MMMMTMMINKKTNLTLTATMLTILLNLSLQTKVNSKTSYMFSSDLISFWMTSMSMMVFFTLSFMNQNKMTQYKKIMTMMIVVLTATFNNWNFLTFYMMFEMSMIVILMVIMSWGYQPERTEAIMFMIIMTLIFSLPFMNAMLTNKKNLNFWFLEINMHMTTFMSFMFIFMMKMPIYFMHFWLPKVHVEAPVQGSMILAAVLLKLGCYGMMRMNNMMKMFQKTKPILISMSVVSMLVLSMNCMMQTDMKTLIAFSSIVHMTLVFTNILMMKNKSMFSSMMIILGHGLCAASLFFMANKMYENSKSRSILMNKGILTILPTMTLMWFLSCMNNAPMPPSMNMMGELICFKNMINWSELMYPVMMSTALASSMYSIYMFCVPSHGKMSKSLNKIKMNTTKTTMNMVMMMAPITSLTVKPAMMMI